METPQETAPYWHSGLQWWLPPWERRHLRAWAGARVGASSILAVCGVLTLAFGGSEGKTYGFAALFLGAAVLTGAAGYWELTLTRSAAGPG